MPGNEKDVVKLLLSDLGHINLMKIGVLLKIQNPSPAGGLQDLVDLEDLKTDDSSKKADVYLNGLGVSIKQSGSSVSYNRLQRASILQLFTNIGLNVGQKILGKLDVLVESFHYGRIMGRDRPWSEAFEKKEFKVLLEYLMMFGSGVAGRSRHPAELILTAPLGVTSAEEMSVETFDEYFENHSSDIFMSIRRQWVGQGSRSEHGRALSLQKKPDNSPWVFSDVQGSPHSGWLSDSDWPIENRKTVYFISFTIK
jgi:hypothetical protein